MNKTVNAMERTSKKGEPLLHRIEASRVDYLDVLRWHKKRLVVPTPHVLRKTDTKQKCIENLTLTICEHTSTMSSDVTGKVNCYTLKIINYNVGWSVQVTTISTNRYFKVLIVKTRLATPEFALSLSARDLIPRIAVVMAEMARLLTLFLKSCYSLINYSSTVRVSIRNVRWKALVHSSQHNYRASLKRKVPLNQIWMIRGSVFPCNRPRLNSWIIEKEYIRKTGIKGAIVQVIGNAGLRVGNINSKSDLKCKLYNVNHVGYKWHS